MIDDRFYTMRGQGSNTGGVPVIPPSAGVLTAITVTQLPDKTSYYVGDYFNPVGCEVIATYTNGSYDVSNGCTYFVNAPLGVADTSVEVNYGGFTTSFTISVTYPSVPAPAGTMLLLHCNGDLINEVTGDMTDISGTYYQAEGKFGFGHSAKDSAVHLRNFYPSENPTNWGFGWWTYAQEGNYGNEDWNVEDWQYSGMWNSLFNVVNSNGNCYLTSSYGIEITNSVIDNTIPATDLHLRWVYYAIQIRGSTVYFYINGILTSHATITHLGKMEHIVNRANGNPPPIDEVIIANGDVYQVNNGEWYIRGN